MYSFLWHLHFVPCFSKCVWAKSVLQRTSNYRYAMWHFRVLVVHWWSKIIFSRMWLQACRTSICLNTWQYGCVGCNLHLGSKLFCFFSNILNCSVYALLKYLSTSFLYWIQALMRILVHLTTIILLNLITKDFVYKWWLR